MIRPIMKDVNFLSKKSVVATKADLAVANDLVVTLRANLDGCVGMAANNTSCSGICCAIWA